MAMIAFTVKGNRLHFWSATCQMVFRGFSWLWGSGENMKAVTDRYQ